VTSALDIDHIARRLLALHNALRELERPEAADPDRLTSDRVLRAAVERWLQVAIEACVDLAYERIAAEGWTPPDHARGAFLVLAGHAVISSELAVRLGSAAGLRNVLVHDYVAVDLVRIASIVAKDLGDLRTFAKLASTWIPG
jgi:uncharacterized protein YutE (UPF0331/DUF86 family)